MERIARRKERFEPVAAVLLLVLVLASTGYSVSFGSNSLALLSSTDATSSNFHQFHSGSIAQSLYRPASAVSAPSGVLAYVPITLENSQTIPTAAPFQQMITVDSASYESYEAVNLENVEFFSASGAIIPSWLESGNSSATSASVYWVNLASGIGAGQSITVFMGFAATSTNLLNDTTTGEAPQLSAVGIPSNPGSSGYAKYDDGAAIFSAYQNFANDRNVIPSGWYSSGIGGPCNYNQANFVNGYDVGGVNGCGVIDMGSDFAVSSSSIVELQIQTLQTTGNDWQAPFVDSTSPTSFSPQGDAVEWIDSNDPCNTFNSNSGAPLTVVSSLGGSNIASASGAYPPMILGISSSHVYANYSPVLSEQGLLTPNGYFAFATHTSSACGSNVEGYWVRTRAAPPNGEMPSTTFGSLSTVQTGPSPSPSPSPSPAGFLGLPGNEGYYLVTGILVAAALGVGVALGRYGRKPVISPQAVTVNAPPPPPPPPPPP